MEGSLTPMPTMGDIIRFGTKAHANRVMENSHEAFIEDREMHYREIISLPYKTLGFGIITQICNKFLK